MLTSYFEHELARGFSFMMNENKIGEGGIDNTLSLRKRAAGGFKCGNTLISAHG